MQTILLGIIVALTPSFLAVAWLVWQAMGDHNARPSGVDLDSFI
jgi:hypothetical protein